MELVGGADAMQDAGDSSAVHEIAGLTQAAWRKSSWSTYSGNCVEVAPLDGGQVAVRDTMDRASGHVLVFSGTAWSSFLSGLRNG